MSCFEFPQSFYFEQCYHTFIWHKNNLHNKWNMAKDYKVDELWVMVFFFLWTLTFKMSSAQSKFSKTLFISLSLCDSICDSLKFLRLFFTIPLLWYGYCHTLLKVRNTTPFDVRLALKDVSSACNFSRTRSSRKVLTAWLTNETWKLGKKYAWQINAQVIWRLTLPETLKNIWQTVEFWAEEWIDEMRKEKVRRDETRRDEKRPILPAKISWDIKIRWHEIGWGEMR